MHWPPFFKELTPRFGFGLLFEFLANLPAFFERCTRAFFSFFGPFFCDSYS